MVFFDPVHVPLVMKVVSTPAVDPDVDPDVDPCTMCFHGTANAHPVLVAADSQASTSFVDINFVRAHGLSCTPTSR